MCVKQKCTSVADLRISMYGNKACPNDCNGNGVCNSLGHCHCNPGFRPPDCIQPGMGGSNDSGPAEDPNGKYFRHFSMFFSPSLSLPLSYYYTRIYSILSYYSSVFISKIISNN